MGRDLEQPDAVLELHVDRSVLVGDQPAGRVGGGHRVVRAGEHHLVEPALAQLRVAIARLRHVGLDVLRLAREGEQEDDHCNTPQRSAAGGYELASAHRALTPDATLARLRRGRDLEHLAGADVEQRRATGDREHAQRENRVQDRQQAECDGRCAPRRTHAGGRGTEHDALKTPQPNGGRVRCDDRPRGRRHDPGRRRDHQRQGRQIAEIRIPERAESGLRLRGRQLGGRDQGRCERALEQSKADREGEGGDADGDAHSGQRPAAIGSDRNRRHEQRDGNDRKHQAEDPNHVRDPQRRRRKAPLLQR